MDCIMMWSFEEKTWKYLLCSEQRFDWCCCPVWIHGASPVVSCYQFSISHPLLSFSSRLALASLESSSTSHTEFCGHWCSFVSFCFQCPGGSCMSVKDMPSSCLHAACWIYMKVCVHVHMCVQISAFRNISPYWLLIVLCFWESVLSLVHSNCSRE